LYLKVDEGGVNPPKKRMGRTPLRSLSRRRVSGATPGTFMVGKTLSMMSRGRTVRMFTPGHFLGHKIKVPLYRSVPRAVSPRERECERERLLCIHCERIETARTFSQGKECQDCLNRVFGAPPLDRNLFGPRADADFLPGVPS